MGAAFGTNDPPPPDDWGCLSFRRGWRVFGELVSVGGFTGTEFRRPPPPGGTYLVPVPPLRILWVPFVSREGFASVCKPDHWYQIRRPPC